jgi:AcrR family transcriptional regulator
MAKTKEKNQPEAVDGRSRRARLARRARRNQVLGCALEVFAEKGYHATSISDIIKAAGIARGTFYLYFENKRAIFEELLDSFITRIAEAVERVSLDPDAATPTEQIRRNVARVVDVLVDNQKFTKILLRQAVGLDREFDARLAELYGRMIDLIEGAVTLGIQMKLVRQCNPRIVAGCILGSIKEVANQFLLDPASWQPDRDELVQEILDYNLKGVFAW